ncbi:MAG: hypothetical protein EBU46_15025 [Nitrosomonadaceae bacterium]|nr:hypothetical protein [Nitrosomonadaceae bacterium]
MELKVTKDNQVIKQDELNVGDVLSLEMPDRDTVPVKVMLMTVERDRATAYAPRRQFGCFLRFNQQAQQWYGAQLFAGHTQPTIIVQQVQ